MLNSYVNFFNSFEWNVFHSSWIYLKWRIFALGGYSQYLCRIKCRLIASTVRIVVQIYRPAARPRCTCAFPGLVSATYWFWQQGKTCSSRVTAIFVQWTRLLNLGDPGSFVIGLFPFKLLHLQVVQLVALPFFSGIDQGLFFS